MYLYLNKSFMNNLDYFVKLLRCKSKDIYAKIMITLILIYWFDSWLNGKLYVTGKELI